MRRFLSILLLLVFGLPLALPLVAQSDAQLPACCRRDGKHHCMVKMDERESSSTDHRRVSTLQETCSYCPAVLNIGNNPAMGLPMAWLLPAFYGQSAVVMQAQISQRIAQERARHKRGPPTFFSL